MDAREELTDELTAILAASRELTPATDRYLAEQFVERLDKRVIGTNRKRRSAPRRSRSPRQMLAALVIGGVALVVGTPLALHIDQNDASPSSFAVPAVNCSWQLQTRVFHSLRAQLQWRESANPKTYRILNHLDVKGNSAVVVAHWACHQPSGGP